MYTLSEVCSLITDGSHFSPEDEGTGYPMLSVKDMRDDGFDYSSCKYVGEDAFKTLVENGCKPQINDVVVAKDGSYLKAAFSIKENLNIVLLSSIAILRPKLDILYPDYLSYYFRSEAVYRTVSLNYITGTALKRIILQGIRKLQINLPTIEEQKMIVKKLDKINCLISLRKKQLQKLDDLVKARFVEMFGDAKQEDTLLNLCNIIDYRGKTPEKVEDGLPFITAKNVRMHQLSIEPREYISKETYNSVMTRGFPREGDVVFTTEAPLGNVCRLPHFDTEFYVGQRIVTLQTKKLIPAYLEYALDTDEFRRKIEGKSSGSTVTGIRVRLLEQLTIPVPNRASQEQFSAFVSQVDKSKLSIQQSLEKLETLKQSLLQQYF